MLHPLLYNFRLCSHYLKRSERGMNYKQLLDVAYALPRPPRPPPRPLFPLPPAPPVGEGHTTKPRTFHYVLMNREIEHVYALSLWFHRNCHMFVSITVFAFVLYKLCNKHVGVRSSSVPPFSLSVPGVRSWSGGVRLHLLWAQSLCVSGSYLCSVLLVLFGLSAIGELLVCPVSPVALRHPPWLYIVMRVYSSETPLWRFSLRCSRRELSALSSSCQPHYPGMGCFGCSSQDVPLEDIALGSVRV